MPGRIAEIFVEEGQTIENGARGYPGSHRSRGWFRSRMIGQLTRRSGKLYLDSSRRGTW